MNEADANSETCCLGTDFIPLAHTNISADLYPYNDAYNSIENLPIVSGDTAYNHPNGTTYIHFFKNCCIMTQIYNTA